MKIAELRAVTDLLSSGPWTMAGRPEDRIIEGEQVHPDGAKYCVAEQLCDPDAIGISVLRNHAPAIIDLIAAVTAWRDLRYSHLRAVIMGSAPDTEDAHRERLLRQSAAAERIESALDKLESIP